MRNDKKQFIMRKIPDGNVLDLRKIIVGQMPKYEKRALAKKEAEKYFQIYQSDKSKAVKYYHKSKHFLGWVVKLLVPDFLIGYPNLWDNLKTLRKAPQFQPFRMALAAWLIFSITFGSMGIYSLNQAVKIFAATFADDIQTEYDSGTYNFTQWDGVNNWVELSAPPTAGDYTSSVKDGGGNSQWNSIAWVPQRPTGKELPDNAGIETAYPTGNADMTGNVLLMHMNEASGTLIDSSGQGNNGTNFGATYGATGKFNGAMSFDGADDYVDAGTSPITGSQAFTLSAWIKTSVLNKYQGAVSIGRGGVSGQSAYIGTVNAVQVGTSNSLGGGFWGRNYGSGITNTGWNHVVMTFSGGSGTARLYVNGVERTSDTHTPSIQSTTMVVGRIADSTLFHINGEVDEVAIFNRALSATEIADHYKRGALKLKYQVRSCDDAVCAGESFMGPDGTGADFYEWKETRPITLPSHTLTNVPNNQYFQYKAFFETDDASFSPELKNVTTDYTILNAPPATPTNVVPASGASGQDLNVGLTGSVYSDADSDPQTNAEWQVDDNADFSSPVWTRTAGVAEISTTVATSTGTFANELAGKTELDHNTVYHWQVRYHDGTVWSSYSTATNFTTNLINAPNNVSPTNGATGQDLNVGLTTSAFSDDQAGHTHANTEWRVDDNSNFSSPEWTRTAGVAETSTSITASNGTFANNLAGMTELAHNTAYYWQARYQDSSGFWSEHSTSTNFVTNLIHTPTNVSPAGGATVTTLSPLLTASAFSDDQPGHTHAASQWQVDDNSDFSSPEYNPGETTSGEISHAVPAGSLSNFKTYNWRVRYKDSGGQWSNYSTSTNFSIQISSTAVEVRPILSGDSFKPGQAVPIEVQLVNFSDGSPLNSATSTVSIYNPTGTKVVDSVAMTYQTGSHGTYRYNYTAPAVAGSYRYEVNASQDGDSGYASANFYVTPPYVVAVNPLGFNVEIKGGDSVNLDVQVINTVDDAVINDASATITIRDPSGTALVSSVAMTYISGSDGLYRYTYTTPTPTGTYSFEVSAVKSGVTGFAGSNFYISPTAAVIEQEAAAQTAERAAQDAERTAQTTERTDQSTERTAQTAERTAQTSERTDQAAERTAQTTERTAQATSRTEVSSIASNMDILIGAMIVTQSTVNDASASTTSFTTSLVNSMDDFYKNAVLTFTSGALDGQSRRISGYIGSTKVITLDPALISAPANGDAFTIVAQNVRVEEQVAEHEAAQATERVAQTTERANQAVERAAQTTERTTQADFRTVTRADTISTLSKLDSILADINRIGTPSTIVHRVNTDAMSPVLNQISSDLKQVLAGVEVIDFATDPIFQTLLDISKINTSDLGKVKNKLADLQAVSSITRRVVEQQNVEPIVETWMTFDSVVFNFLITNPAQSKQTIKFKAFLPQEVRPEHIMDLSGLQINYDANAQTFYVSGDIALGPKESVTRNVKIKDIWVYSEGEIESLGKQAQTLAEPLAGTQYLALGAVLKNEIDATLGILLLAQEEGYRSPQDHIVTHRENVKRMEQVDKNLDKLRDLVVQAGASRGVVGQIGGIQTFSTWGIILAIVFGFGLLSAVIFAMWRHQTMLAAAAMGMPRREMAAHFGGIRSGRRRKPVKNKVIEARSRSVQVSFIQRLPWKKILVWFAVIGIVAILGIVAVRFVPGLFGSQEVKFENKETPIAALITSREESISSQFASLNQKSFNEDTATPLSTSLLDETNIEVEVFFDNSENKEKDEVVSESINSVLKITDTPTDWLNVRDDSALDGKTITKVYPGEEYEYTDEQNGWYQIILTDGEHGWIFGEYAEVIK